MVRDEGKAPADQAMTFLRRAVGIDFRICHVFPTESALDPLRGREDFKKLLVELDKPSDAEAGEVDTTEEAVRRAAS